MFDLRRIDFETNTQNLVKRTNLDNVMKIIEAANKLVNRNITYIVTHHADSGLVDISAVITAKEYKSICQSSIMWDILYRKEQ